MLVVISPAKKLDYESENFAISNDVPRMLDQTEMLAKKAKRLRAADLKAMMGISDALAELNVARFKAFETPFTSANARPAIDAFKGDVYIGMDAPTMSNEDRNYANERIRILSGLYGLLRPLDLMQAYRLEMGTKFVTRRGKDLYTFWGNRISKALNEDFADDEDPVLVNLASGEYFKAVQQKALKARVITPVFKEVKDGNARVISFLAKKARGMMTRYIVDGRINDVNALKTFDREGYQYDEAASTATEWVFSRPQP